MSATTNCTTTTSLRLPKTSANIVKANVSVSGEASTWQERRAYAATRPSVLSLNRSHRFPAGWLLLAKVFPLSWQPRRDDFAFTTSRFMDMLLFTGFLVVIFLRQFWKIARKPVSCRLVFSCWCGHCQSKLRYIWCSNNLVSKDPLASIELNYCTSNGNPDGLWVPIILEILLAYGLPPIRWTCKGLDSWAQRGPWSWNIDWGLQVSKSKYLQKSAWQT